MNQPLSLKNRLLLQRPYFEANKLCQDERFYSLCDEDFWPLKAEKDLGIPTNYFQLANTPLEGRNPLPSREISGFDRYVELATKLTFLPESKATFNKRTQVVKGVYESYGGILESLRRGSVTGIELFFPLLRPKAIQDLRERILGGSLFPFRYKFWAYFRLLQLLVGDEEAQKISDNPEFSSIYFHASSDYLGLSFYHFPPSQIDLWVEEGNLEALQNSLQDPKLHVQLFQGLIHLTQLGNVEAALLCLRFLGQQLEDTIVSFEISRASLHSGDVEIVNILLPAFSFENEIFGSFFPLEGISDVRQIPQLPPGTFNDPKYEDKILDVLQGAYFGCNSELIKIFSTAIPTNQGLQLPMFSHWVLQGVRFHGRFVEAYSTLLTLIPLGLVSVDAFVEALETHNIDIIRLTYSLSPNEEVLRQKMTQCEGNIDLLINLFMILKSDQPSVPPRYIQIFLADLPRHYQKGFPLSEKICRIEIERFSQ